MKLTTLLEEITPKVVQDLNAGLRPDRTYLVQPRRWAVWLLRGMLAVVVAAGALVFFTG